MSIVLNYLSEDLPVSSYGTEVILNNILKSNMDENEYMLWFTHNYICLISEQYEHNRKSIFYDDVFGDSYEYTTNMLNKYFIPRKYLSKNNIIKTLVEMLEDKQYIVLVIDRYYIKGCIEFNKHHIFHAITIFGYDSIDRSFCTSDFFNYNPYSTLNISYDEMKEAYFPEHTNNLPQEDCIIALSYISPEKRIGKMQNIYYDKSKIIYSIKKHIEGKIFKVNNFNLGVSIYDTAIEMIKNEQYDYKSFHCIYDHKRAMNYRINSLIKLRYIENNVSLIDSINILKNKSLALRNKIIKLSINNNGISSIEKICDEYKHIKESDINICEKILLSL